MEVPNIHPSQYEIPPQPMNTAYPTMYAPPTEKYKGEKINQAFFITIAFFLLSRSYFVMDNAYYMFTQRQFEFIQEGLGTPTTKGAVVVTGLFFLTVLWILYRK